jgi:Spy/CpxP family protein refolding chaperone
VKSKYKSDLGHMAKNDETKALRDAREKLAQRRPELRGKSLEAMRRILRREARLSLRPRRSGKPD